MGCKSKLKYNCGSNKVYATCTYYETTLPPWSKWYNDDCVTVDDTNEEIYEELTKLRDKTDFSDIETSCSEITLQKELGVVTPKSFANTVLNILEDIKCPPTDEALSKKDIDITQYGLNFKCLVDPCGTPITKLSQLLQIMIDKHCP